MAVNENSKIQKVVVLNNVHYPNKNKIKLDPGKKIQKVKGGHFLHLTGKSGRKKNILCRYNKTLSSPSEAYETLGIPHVLLYYQF